MGIVLFGFTREEFDKEAAELLDHSKRTLSHIRDAPGDAEGVSDLFRAVYSLKDLAALAALKEIHDFSAIFEAFVGDLRSGRYEIDEAVVDLLYRSRDALGRLVRHSGPSIGGSLLAEKLGKSTLDRLSNALQGLESLYGGGEDRLDAPSPDGIPDLSSGLSDIETGRREPAKQSKTSFLDPARMDPNYVIKITTLEGIKSLYSTLERDPLDLKEVSRMLKKLEATVVWAFSDEDPRAIKRLNKIKRILSGQVGPSEVTEVKNEYKRLAQSLREGLHSLDGEQGRSAPVEAGEDEIVRITLTDTLSNMASILKEDRVNVERMRLLSDRLLDLNSWAFEDNGAVNDALAKMASLLEGDDASQVHGKLKVAYNSLCALFSNILGVSLGDAVH